MSKLILLRHGQSVWNKLNLFTGWVDIPLSKQGIEESVQAGKQMAEMNVDVIYTSELVRAQVTAFLAMAQHSSGKTPCVEHLGKDEHSLFYQRGLRDPALLIPTYFAWELNERMYGDLQGKNKAQVMAEHGEAQVKLWRRSFRVAPPGGETLEDTAKRSIPFFTQRIIPHLKKGEDVFICAHGNSLRSIVMHIESLSEEEVLSLEIPTGSLRLYEYEDGSFLRK
jgi:2,3-bisphosphoglycerate-dependent phosphoglycerate mutase